MIKVIVDFVLRSKLGDLKQPLELCDESGRILARLIPAPEPSLFEPVEPQLSAEELQRRRAEPDVSTADVLAYLEHL
jgi:hypothetical protein